jgi:hypothetical protein
MDYFPKKTILAIKPRKNVTATVARIHPVLAFVFFCSGVMA